MTVRELVSDMLNVIRTSGKIDVTLQSVSDVMEHLEDEARRRSDDRNESSHVRKIAADLN
jgi:hypothetical protein